MHCWPTALPGRHLHPHPCPSLPHLNYSTSGLPGPASSPPPAKHQPSSSTLAYRMQLVKKPHFYFLAILAPRTCLLCNEEITVTTTRREKKHMALIKRQLKLIAMPLPLSSNAQKGDGASLQLTGQTTHGLYTGSAPWFDSPPLGQCIGQDTPSWEDFRYALTKPNLYTSMKTSHDTPFPHRKTLAFAMKGAAAFRAAGSLTLVSIWYDGLGEKARVNEETFHVFSLSFFYYY